MVQRSLMGQQFLLDRICHSVLMSHLVLRPRWLRPSPMVRLRHSLRRSLMDRRFLMDLLYLVGRIYHLDLMCHLALRVLGHHLHRLFLMVQPCRMVPLFPKDRQFLECLEDRIYHLALMFRWVLRGLGHRWLKLITQGRHFGCQDDGVAVCADQCHARGPRAFDIGICLLYRCDGGKSVTVGDGHQ